MVERKLRSHTPKVRSEKIKRSLLKSTRMFQQHHKQWSTEWVGDRSHTLLKGREMFCNSHSRKKLASIHIHAWLYVNTWVVFKFIFERVVQRQRWGLEYYNKTSEFNATAAERWALHNALSVTKEEEVTKRWSVQTYLRSMSLFTGAIASCVQAGL